jgi:hypothetical protein
MSRIRHRGQKTHEKHSAGGEAGEAKVGNPNVFKLAAGHSVGRIEGSEHKPHLGRAAAKGGKIKAKSRASGGGADMHPYSSAKLSHGGKAGHEHEHKKLHHAAEGHPSGVHHEGHHAMHHGAHHLARGGHSGGRHKA